MPLLDLLLLLTLLIVMPVLGLLVAVICLVPAIDRLLHWRREYLDGFGTALIHHNPEAVIHATLFSTQRVEASKVFETFKRIYLDSGRPEFNRWKQRVIIPCWLWPHWEDASADFDINYHLRAKPERLGKQELAELIGKLQSEPLDFNRPLWQLWHFEHYTDEAGTQCSVTLLRAHHALGDGFALMRVMMQAAKPSRPPEGLSQPRAASLPRISPWLVPCMLMALIRKLLFPQTDKPSAIKASQHLPSFGPRRVAWSSLDLSVADLKALGKSLGGASINDLLLTALYGALQKHVRQSTPAGTRTPDAVKLTMWISCVPLRDIYKDVSELPLRWGNGTLGTCYLQCPVGPDQAAPKAQEALQDLRQATNDPSLMLEAKLACRILQVFGWLPRPVSRLPWLMTVYKATGSVSNVPGPQYSVEWCDVPVGKVLFFVPANGTLSLFVTIATLNGDVTIGVDGDGQHFPAGALDNIVGKLFREEMEALRQAARS